MLRSFSHFMSNQNITATSALYHPNLKLLEITSTGTNENGRWLVMVFPNWFIGFSLRKKMLRFLKNFITSKIAVLPTYSTSQKYKSFFRDFCSKCVQSKLFFTLHSLYALFYWLPKNIFCRC